MKLVEVLALLLIVFGFILFGSLQILILSKKAIYNKWIKKTGSDGRSTFDYVTTFGGLWVVKDIDYDALLNSHPTDIELRRNVKIITITRILSIIMGGLLVFVAIMLKVLE